MRSPLRIAVLLAIASLAVAPRVIAAEPAQSATAPAVVKAAFLLTHGRLPATADLGKLGDGSGENGIPALVERLTSGLASDPAAARAAAELAVQDAFGRAAVASELAGATATPATYAEHLRRHLAGLRDNPAEYDRVIDRAYRFVVRRSAYPEELVYWKKYDTLSYALLVGCIEDWARRNQPGLMVTVGTPTVPINSEFLITVRLSPIESAALGVALGLAPEPDPFLNEAADARTLVAPGAQQLVAAGGIHFAAVGGPKLAAFGWAAETPTAARN